LLPESAEISSSLGNLSEYKEYLSFAENMNNEKKVKVLIEVG